jgi:hypothetical protein
VKTEAFEYGFRVLGSPREPRRLIVAADALAAYATCDDRCELEQESYLSLFQFGPDFREHLESTNTVRGFAGPCWAPFLWFDVDNNDPAAALNSARRLVVAIDETLGVDRDDLPIFFSGSKGYHIGVPTAPWAPPPTPDFHATCKAFCAAVAEHAEARIDGGIYDRVRIFRAPNSRHPKSGLHKRFLTAEELLGLGPDRIREFAREPVAFELPECDATYPPSDKACKLWEAAAAEVRERTHTVRRSEDGGSARLNRVTLEFIREGARPGERQTRLYSAAANLAEFGAPLALCEGLLTEAARDSGLPPSEIKRTIRGAWGSQMQGQEQGEAT